MTELARFLNARKLTEWSESAGMAGISRFQINSPAELKGQAWRLPKRRYARPLVIRGQAKIQEDEESWLVISASQHELVFSSAKEAEKPPSK